jgi:hypothetical protein
LGGGGGRAISQPSQNSPPKAIEIQKIEIQKIRYKR